MDFKYAAELKKRFFCYGHFYELLLMNGSREKCRSVLEIVDSSIPQDVPSDISELKPDAVVIMMNPGSSHPKDLDYIPAELEYPLRNVDQRKDLVLTQPDNTQYQVMRIGVELGWRHIRVLNLSDLRDPKSGNFLQKVDDLRSIFAGHVHSVFCEERMDECAHALDRNGNMPIMLGWGQDARLIPLVEQCLGRIKSEPTATVVSNEHPLLNAHPSPMLQKKKLEWLESMLSQYK